MGAAPEPQGRLSAQARLARQADAMLAALERVAPAGALAGFTGAGLLGERERLGARPAMRSCRLIEARDGWLALNLARAGDWDLLAAWLEAPVAADWDAIANAVRFRNAAALVERGREIGLAVALDRPPQKGVGLSYPAKLNPTPFFASVDALKLNPTPFRRRPRVVELASLWAGPLCGRLLAKLGAEVTKVESTQRPDGARRGSPAFFDALNAHKRQVALDFDSNEGRGELERLVRGADIVIEGSRPRALRQLGIHAEQLVAANPRLTWIGITGYGRGPAQENWIAYGDDAAVDAGLSHLHRQETGRREIVGDAVADPLAGIAAALAAWTGYRAGGAGLVPLALAGVVGDALSGSYSKDSTVRSGET